MDFQSDHGFQKALWTRKNDVGGSVGDDNDDDGGGLVKFNLKTRDRSILPLRPQPSRRAQRHVTPAGITPSFPRATTMTTSTRGGALHNNITYVNIPLTRALDRFTREQTVRLQTDRLITSVPSVSRDVMHREN